MSKEELLDYLDSGREIEFKWNGNMYSITYGKINGRSVISFCEFYKESTEVETPAELLNVKRDNTTVLDMLQSLTDNDIWIY
ncbi:MAG: hypothetical protein IJ251_01635 [Oscillospiraceae bacterium]|nr:hypothetical protein [Oscillospiraceae bacterium]